MNISVIGPTLARQGIRTCAGISKRSEAASVGEVFLGSIEQKSDSEMEKSIAHVSRAAFANAKNYGWLRLAADHEVVQNTLCWAAMRVVADGVSGPLAGALAQVGWLTMNNTREGYEKPLVPVAVTFTEAVRDASDNPAVKAQADAALAAASHAGTTEKVEILEAFLSSQYHRPDVTNFPG
jgi:hypothetical protein